MRCNAVWRFASSFLLFLDGEGNATCIDDTAPSLGRSCACNDGYTGDAAVGCTGLIQDIHFVMI